MSLQKLDRTQWSYAEALAHVENVTVARRVTEAAKLPPKPAAPHESWGFTPDPTIAWKADAQTEFLVALRDGDLLAKGRFTETRTGWAEGVQSGFGLHSGYHTSIRPEQWREGQYHSYKGTLTARDWEFIDIRVPRFLVKAIWPDYIPEAARSGAGAGRAPYTTPYLDLMQEAIRHFRLTERHQEKKEVLSDWFRSKLVDGDQVSSNLAHSMATLIRLPSAQRGGAKRVPTPTFRKTG